MAYQPAGNKPLIRHFGIVTGPSIADPAWLIAAFEYDEFRHPINYSSLEPIKDLIAECELRSAKNAGRCEEYNRICEMFGVKSPVELEALAKKVKEL